MNRKNIVLIIVVIFGLMSALGCSDSDDNSETTIESEDIQTGEVKAVQEEEPAPASAEETEVVAETPASDDTEEPKTVTLEEAKAEETPVKNENEDLEEEYRARLEKQKEETEEEYEDEKYLESEETLENEETPISGTSMQLSESKKEELIEIVKEYSGSDEVEVLYISPTESSPTGLMMVSYYLDFPPSKDKLEDDLTAIVIFSKQIAKESGITNTGVNAVAMLRDGTGLGAGNYYASTGETDIFIQP